MIPSLSRSQDMQGRSLWSGLLIVALLCAAQHLVMHDIDVASGGPLGHQECQLNHLPCAAFASPTLGLPLLAPIFLRAVPRRQYFPFTLVYSWLSRAPPLS